MTVHLLTFADNEMFKSAQLCVDSAMAHGVHLTHWCGPSTVRDLPYYSEHESLFTTPRGVGFWAWKPALLDRAMGDDSYLMDVRDGDILIYADAGIEFIDNVFHIIDRMDQDIFLFGNQWEHAHWCKRDIVDAIMPNTPWEAFGKQVQASVIIFRVNDKTRAFVKEWLDWCLFEGGRLIDDSSSRTPNHPEFQENRHDQAILTTLAYRDGIKLHWWPAMYNDGAFVYERGDYPDEGYPVLFHHHRRRDHEWKGVAA